MRPRLHVLRHRAFRNLWLAQSTSVIGDRIVLVALALFVTDLTGSATKVGLVLGAATLPFVAFLLVGGVWADRLPRARLMLATDLVRATLHGTLAALILLDAVELWHLLVIEALFGTAEAFFRPAYTGLLPRTVPAPEIQPALALSTMTANVAEFAGPALATGLVLGLGAGWAFAVDAATFVVSAFFLTRVRVADEPRTVRRRTMLAELADGYREVRSRDWLWVTIAVFSFALFAGLGPYFVLGPTIAEDLYGEPGVFGLITAVFGAGAIAGGLAGLRWRPLHPMRAAYFALAGWPALLIAFALGAPIAGLVAVALAMGAGFALFDVWWHTALGERIPGDALSRVSAFDWMGSLAFLPLGYITAGPLADAFGATTVMLAGGIVTAVAIVLGLLPRDTRSLRRIDHEPVPAVPGPRVMP